MGGHLNVGVLGMPDNIGTFSLLERFDREPEVSLDFVVYWQPSFRAQWSRFMRKLRLAGPRATMLRVADSLRRRRARASAEGPAGARRKPLREYFVGSHNGPDCEELLRREQVDLVLLETDCIIRSSVLKVPRLGVLNAHPGWIPRFRGLGALLFQLEQGFKPAVTLHFADEGVDTGPVILRREFEFDATRGLDGLEQATRLAQGDVFVEAVQLFQRGAVPRVDTFLEPSNMTRGMPLKRVRALDRALRRGELRPDRSLR
jgi:hypothetical protein